MPWIRTGVLSLLLVIAVSSLYLAAHGQAGSSAKNGPKEMPSAASAASSQSPALDFEFFKTRVEPIFLKERVGHAPCYSCHILGNRAFHLQTLSPGSTAWTDEQSQLNFKTALDQVEPGDVFASRLLTHPLAPEAGGDAFHSGGRQFDSQGDTDWQVIADWVRGAGTRSTSNSSSGTLSRIYVTNSAGDTIDVIDPGTNQVVQVIRGIE